MIIVNFVDNYEIIKLHYHYIVKFCMRQCNFGAHTYMQGEYVKNLFALFAY